MRLTKENRDLKENYKKTVILKEYHDSPNFSALSNLLSMVMAAQQPPLNPQALNSTDKIREGTFKKWNISGYS